MPKIRLQDVDREEETSEKFERFKFTRAKLKEIDREIARKEASSNTVMSKRTKSR